MPASDKRSSLLGHSQITAVFGPSLTTLITTAIKYTAVLLMLDKCKCILNQCKTFQHGSLTEGEDSVRLTSLY
jgi:hypothetical protein